MGSGNGEITPVNVGVVGCGTISGVYLRNMGQLANLHVSWCADLDLERARLRAEEHNVSHHGPFEEMLADPDVELVVNLTVPAVHAEVSRQALTAGKHVYSEKPLALDRADGRSILRLAEEQDLLVGCAPDTFLGGGMQTARQLLDEGMIGEVVGAACFLSHTAPERWHPNPEFFYQPGAGPLFDMGPYYLSTLIALLGPIRRVTGSARITHPTRVIGSEPLAGQTITVRTPTHVSAVFDFVAGPSATLTTSFDLATTSLPPMEIFGTTGTMQAPDPNIFGGPIRVKTIEEKEWREVALTHGFTRNWRGIGVSDLARAIRCGEPPRASGLLGYHVLDVMQAVLDASEQERHITVESTVERPEPLQSDELLAVSC